MKLVISFIVGIIIVGLCVAILRVFNWDFVAAIQWILGLGSTLINTVANFFQSNPTFQQFVVKK